MASGDLFRRMLKSLRVIVGLEALAPSASMHGWTLTSVHNGRQVLVFRRQRLAGVIELPSVGMVVIAHLCATKLDFFRWVSLVPCFDL